tara:strand:+ start:2328 stop:2618 length:291 start_codon:yes stop_codon:yes gene_type:complete
MSHDRKSEEIQRRIKLSIAAYAYEIKDDSIMSDESFDEESRKVDLSISTGNKKMDNFFKKHFTPSTGQWIYNHPHLKRIDELYTNIFATKRDHNDN